MLNKNNTRMSHDRVQGIDSPSRFHAEPPKLIQCKYYSQGGKNFKHPLYLHDLDRLSRNFRCLNRSMTELRGYQMNISERGERCPIKF